jgi:hypothetical protein
MKKMMAVLIGLGLAVSVFSMADAGNSNGMGGGCSNCAQAGVSSDPFRKFQEDTIDLRQEMMVKRFEAQRENLKGAPDTAKIAALQAEIKVIQARIHDIRTQSGLPTDKCDGECGPMMGGCDKKAMGGCDKNAMGDCGKNMGGCNKGPCGQK